MRHNVAEGRRGHKAERGEEKIRFSHIRECLRIAKVRMSVTETNFSSEKRRRLRPLEDALSPSLIAKRRVKETTSVRSPKVVSDNLNVTFRLFFREYPRKDAVDHWESAVSHSTHSVTRMEKVTHMKMIPSAMNELRRTNGKE
jgi:hypothetical protein